MCRSEKHKFSLGEFELEHIERALGREMTISESARVESLDFVSELQLETARTIVQNYNTIPAVWYIRSITGCSLDEAKQFLDTLNQ